MIAASPTFRTMEPSMPLFNVGFVIFPHLTQLDFTGPQQVLAGLPESAMHIVAKSAVLVPSESGLGLVPTHTFENCPRLDLICVPGGTEVSFKRWRTGKRSSLSEGSPARPST
jgi:transcriptional regulator GlxA family with amidase domain